MALRVITPTHIWVFKSYVYYAKTTIHSNGLLNCTASKRGPSSNACASRRGYTYWHAQGDYAQYRAFTVVNFHVLPRYHAPCTGARARVIAQNIAYHFTRGSLGMGLSISSHSIVSVKHPLLWVVV